jgi:hypothetical protein
METTATQKNSKSYLVDHEQAEPVPLKTGRQIMVFPGTFLHRLLFAKPIIKGGKDVR